MSDPVPVTPDDFINAMKPFADFLHDCMLVGAQQLYFDMEQIDMLHTVKRDDIEPIITLLACRVMAEYTDQISGQALSLIEAQKILKNLDPPPGD